VPIDRNILAVRGPGATGDQHVTAMNDMRAIFALDLNRIRIGEARIAFEGGDVITAKLCLDNLDLARHNCLRPEDQVSHRNAIL
jgi:hypothetical protein